MEPQNYRERIVENIAQAAVWVFKETGANFQHMKNYILDGTLSHADDAFVNEVLAKYEQMGGWVRKEEEE